MSRRYLRQGDRCEPGECNYRSVCAQKNLRDFRKEPFCLGRKKGRRNSACRPGSCRKPLRCRKSTGMCWDGEDDEEVGIMEKIVDAPQMLQLRDESRLERIRRRMGASQKPVETQILRLEDTPTTDIAAIDGGEMRKCRDGRQCWGLPKDQRRSRLVCRRPSRGPGRAKRCRSALKGGARKKSKKKSRKRSKKKSRKRSKKKRSEKIKKEKQKTIKKEKQKTKKKEIKARRSKKEK